MLGTNGLKEMLLYWCMCWEHMRWCMPNFGVAWARRFSCSKYQEYFSLPANVHPASYLDFIYSRLNKVDPTRSQCVLHVTSRVVLRREGKYFFEIYCSYLYARSNFDEYTRYFVLKRTKVYGLRFISFYAPAKTCEVHLLLSQMHTPKCPNKIKYNPSKDYY